jgi:hypothetical protein
MLSCIAEALNLSRAKVPGVISCCPHDRKFREPRMRQELMALLDADGEGVHPLVREALSKHRSMVVA